MRKSSIDGAPKFRSGSFVRSGAKAHKWRTTDGVKHPVTVRRVAPRVAA